MTRIGDDGDECDDDAVLDHRGAPLAETALDRRHLRDRPEGVEDCEHRDVPFLTGPERVVG